MRVLPSSSRFSVWRSRVRQWLPAGAGYEGTIACMQACWARRRDVLFGVTAGLLKLIGGQLGTAGVGTAGLALFVAALVGTGILGTAINQRAYQIAPLAFSMPLVNVVDVLIAIGFGGLVFGEVPGHGPGGVVVQAIALATIAVGLREIARLAPRRREPLAPRRVRVTGATR